MPSSATLKWKEHNNLPIFSYHSRWRTFLDKNIAVQNPESFFMLTYFQAWKLKLYSQKCIILQQKCPHTKLHRGLFRGDFCHNRHNYRLWKFSPAVLNLFREKKEIKCANCKISCTDGLNVGIICVFFALVFVKISFVTERSIKCSNIQ